MNVIIGAEPSYIGALLWQTADDALELTKLVEADDFYDLKCAAEFELIRKLAKSGKRPEPQSLVRFAVDSGAVRGEDRTSKLAAHIVKLYTEVPMRHKDIAHEYREHVLTDALKRALHTLGQRVEQAAESEPEEIIFEVLCEEMDRVRSIEHRRNKAKGTE